MKALDRVVRRVAPKDVTITLIGESGTGKEVLAKRVHDLSGRRAGAFIPINCAAIPDTLFESELFGHERGAFTGASERVIGKVEAADGGTLFLDEIGEMPLAMQAKLLRFLENHRFMRVGGTKKIQVDTRLVFATLRPLEDDVKAGRFRGDLFYRIQGITLSVPPLRERPHDIGALLDHFVAELSTLHAVQRPRFSRKARTLLLAHDWPGNVRELRNVVESMCLLREGRSVRAADLPAAIANAPRTAEHAVADRITLPIGDLESMVGEIVGHVLRATHANKSEAARKLGVSVRTLQRYVAQGRVRPT
jgi:transcriptional regulator with PAS, ATPase and Fis domain